MLQLHYASFGFWVARITDREALESNNIISDLMNLAGAVLGIDCLQGVSANGLLHHLVLK